MMSPSITRTTPTSPPSSRNAIAAYTFCGAMKTAWKSASAAFCVRRLPGGLHLHRGGREHRQGPHLGRRALRQGLQHRLQPLHLLRLLCRGLPTDAITHGHGFELASFNTSTLVYRKEQLLEAAPAVTAP